MEIMINLIPNILELWSCIFITMTVYILTYFGVFHPMFRLSILNIFNRKPFSCWLCSNFWLNVLIYINMAYINPCYLLWGAVLTGMTTYVIYHDPNP